MMMMMMMMIMMTLQALFRRGKAHVGAWNPDSAKADFNKVQLLDSSLAGTLLILLIFVGGVIFNELKTCD